MSPEVRERYEKALDVLRGIVAGTGEARDRIQSLLRATASEIKDALEREGEDADFDGIIEAFRVATEEIVMENMRVAAGAAEDADSEPGLADIAIAASFVGIDISTPIERYASALSQEVKWFVAGGFAYSALRDYLKDPMGFLAAESVKPAKKGSTTRQSAGRMTLAPAFMDGRRRRSLSEVLADFRDSVTAVGSGNSYQVGKSVWMLLNVTSMEAYNEALAMKWSGRGAIGYYVFRASTYDCPLCDEQCGYLHPLTEMVVPVHPHCVCVTIEAYGNETQEDFEI